MHTYKSPDEHFQDVPDEAPPYSEDANPETTNNETSGGAAPNAAPRDSKASYALTLQRACASALRQMKSNEMIADSTWAAPLAAAPLAISTMAILLKAADMEAAAGLEIETQEISDKTGKVAGRLP